MVLSQPKGEVWVTVTLAVPTVSKATVIELVPWPLIIEPLDTDQLYESPATAGVEYVYILL